MHGTKIINWSTPKDIKAEKRQHVSTPGKSKWQCKKNKGKHIYGKPEPLRIFNGDIYGYGMTCSGCGKKRYIGRTLAG